MTTYANPWHVKGYGPAVYETTARPIEHAGCLIYQRIPGHVCMAWCDWIDSLADGQISEALAQRATL